jgi:3-deoxy-D-manno-octulosonate 8-phosphate phosphatase KdsC-like HAD superfamily phosphatase
MLYEEVKKYVNYVSAFSGGKGVVREAIKLISEKNLWQI